MSETTPTLLLPHLTATEGLVFDIEPGRLALPSSTIIDQMMHVWNPEYYHNPRTPLHVGSIMCRDTFSQPNGLAVLDMPIKFPGSNTVRLPRELAQFDEAVRKIGQYEATINPALADYFAYLTVDQRTVGAGATQRVSGKHVDGIQGKNVTTKVAVEQTYILSDKLTTTAYVQPFDFSGKSVNTHNWFKLMEEQASPTAAVQGDPYEIYLIDPYTVHAGIPATEPTARTFLRLEFSLREYDRVQNTHNPMFDYRWDMVDRDVSGDLI